MHAINVLRQLWHRRRLLPLVAVVAVLAGMAVTYNLPSLQSRSYDVSVATGQILLDTPNSQVVALSPKGSDTLGYRADLIASLMVGSTIESAIAQRAGLHPSQLSGTTNAVALAGAYGGSTPASSQVPSGPDAHILTTNTLTDLTNNPLPIIQFAAQAPNPAAALRLANATIAGLRDYLDTKAAAERIPDAGRVQVNGVGVPQVTTQSHGPTAMVAILAVILVLALGCAAIVGLPVLARSWRAAEAFEEQEGDSAVAAEHEVEVGAVLGYQPKVSAHVAGSNGVAKENGKDRLVAASVRTFAGNGRHKENADEAPATRPPAGPPADRASQEALDITQWPAASDTEPADGRRAIAKQRAWSERRAQSG
jgi:hypothetical protein